MKGETKMNKEEIKKLGEKAEEKISGGVKSLKEFIKKPGSIFIKKYGGIPIRPPVKPPVKPIEPVKPVEPAKQPEQPVDPLVPANPVQPSEPKKEENK